jgi:hypothetical protein
VSVFASSRDDVQERARRGPAGAGGRAAVLVMLTS